MKIPRSPSSVDNLVDKLLYGGKLVRMTRVLSHRLFFRHPLSIGRTASNSGFGRSSWLSCIFLRRFLGLRLSPLWHPYQYHHFGSLSTGSTLFWGWLLSTAGARFRIRQELRRRKTATSKWRERSVDQVSQARPNGRLSTITVLYQREKQLMRVRVPNQHTTSATAEYRAQYCPLPQSRSWP